MDSIILLEQVKEWSHVRLSKSANLYEVFFWDRHPDHRPKWQTFPRKADAVKFYKQISAI